eukprot:jgi/Ulvmu1/4963/UM207_0007.1
MLRGSCVEPVATQTWSTAATRALARPRGQVVRHAGARHVQVSPGHLMRYHLALCCCLWCGVASSLRSNAGCVHHTMRALRLSVIQCAAHMRSRPGIAVRLSVTSTAKPPVQRSTLCMAQQASDLPGNLRNIVGAFQMVPDPMARYKQLLFFASKLEGLEDTLKTEENKVQGCVSQVWVIPEVQEGKMYWKADSDAQLTKGLAALLVQGLSGCTPQEICGVEPNFIELLGLKQSLTPSRNNGFLNMFRLMQRQALLAMQNDGQIVPTLPGGDTSGGSGSGPSAMMAAVTSSWEPSDQEPKPVAASIRRKIEEELAPSHLEVIDESASHAGHAGARETHSPSGETHMKLKIVSNAFVGVNVVKRHRMVFGLLKDELAGPVHALSLDTKTPAEAS